MLATARKSLNQSFRAAIAALLSGQGSVVEGFPGANLVSGATKLLQRCLDLLVAEGVVNSNPGLIKIGHVFVSLARSKRISDSQ